MVLCRPTEEKRREEIADRFFRLDFCAECLDNFITGTLGRTENDPPLPLGFTVS